ncbi:MAG: transposase [Planctomycetes bacterium]|nr:transposase [Planctomycetota bacterium]
MPSYRRRLPHLRREGGTYFVTWRLSPNQDDLDADERTAIASCLRHFDGDRYALHAYVVMNDHVHVIVEPKGEDDLEAIVQNWKSFSARELQKLGSREGSLWQSEYFDWIIRDPGDLANKVAYIKGNPVKRWPELTSYAWVYVHRA